MKIKNINKLNNEQILEFLINANKNAFIKDSWFGSPIIKVILNDFSYYLIIDDYEIELKVIIPWYFYLIIFIILNIIISLILLVLSLELSFDRSGVIVILINIFITNKYYKYKKNTSINEEFNLISSFVKPTM